MRKILGFLVLAAVFAVPAQASVIIKMKQEFYGKETKTCEMVSAVDASRVRVDSDCGQSMAIIMLRDQKKMVMLSPKGKTYYEMSMEQLEKFTENPMEAMKSDPRYAASLAKMSPEQKAMMEKMMAGAMKKMAEVKTEFKKIGKQKKVGNWSCTTYGVYTNGKLAEDLCIADNGLFPELTPLMSSWKTFQSSWLKFSHAPTMKAHEEAMKVGVTIETLIYTSGKLNSKMDLVDVKSEDRPDSFFQAPADFKKASSPIMK
jgi:hypothetical protein